MLLCLMDFVAPCGDNEENTTEYGKKSSNENETNSDDRHRRGDF